MIGMNSGQAMVSVGVAMILQDQFTNQANNIGKAYRDMMEEIYQSSQASRGLTELVWSRGASGLALSTMGGLIDSYQYMAQAENELFLVQKMTNATLEERKDIMDKIQEVNLKTPLKTEDLASASKFMAMAGNTPKGIQGMLEPVAELASIFGMNPGGKGGVADLFTNISMMFGRNIEDVDEAFNVANEIYATVTRSNTNLQDLAQAITYSGSEMRRAGYGLKETAASIGAMGNYGIQGSAAGTALANMMRYIQLSASGQKKKGADMLAAVGIDAKSLMNSEGHLISLNEIYHKMYEATKDLDTFSKNQFFYNVFGVRGTREIAAMVQMIEDAAGGASKYEQLMQEMNDATANNSVKETTEQRLSTAQGQLDMMASQLDMLKYNIGKALEKPFGNVLSILNSILGFINEISKTGLGGAAVRAVAIGTALQLAIRGLVAIRGLIRIASTGLSQMTAAGAAMSRGPAAANTQFVLMEGHLRTLIVLMGEYMAMNNMIPRGGIATPYGTVFAQGGRARITNTAAGVRGMGLNNGMNAMAGAAMGAAAARTAGAAAGAKVATGVVSRALGFLGGPWGIAITMGLPFIIDLLIGSNDENRKQSELLEESLSANEMKNLEDEALINALRAACKDGIMEGVSNAKPVPVEVSPVEVIVNGNYSSVSNDYNIWE